MYGHFSLLQGFVQVHMGNQEWLEQASQCHEMDCHDLEAVSSNPGWVELGVRRTSVPSHTWTKHKHTQFNTHPTVLGGARSSICMSWIKSTKMEECSTSWGAAEGYKFSSNFLCILIRVILQWFLLSNKLSLWNSSANKMQKWLG